MEAERTNGVDFAASLGRIKLEHISRQGWIDFPTELVDLYIASEPR